MTQGREVTEADFRLPEYRHARPEDYEFRRDGKLVRKDRWETGLRNIVNALGWCRDTFEIEDVVDAVQELVLRAGPVNPPDSDAP
ncbi:hypothetical protein [Chitinimonas lacunae]|uniref:Uncharacterized protein n=1 Tax=Chitinimonas lacunae TaxID=1963018 RepID=A0ABV8MUL5_9NEIS